MKKWLDKYEDGGKIDLNISEDVSPDPYKYLRGQLDPFGKSYSMSGGYGNDKGSIHGSGFIGMPREGHTPWNIGVHADYNISDKFNLFGGANINNNPSYNLGFKYKFPDGGNTPVDYNEKRARELGYGADSTGHWPSVDHETGMWLKSADHPTAFKEYLFHSLNPDMQKNYNVQINPEGFFGARQLQYVPKKQDGGTTPDFEPTLKLFTDKAAYDIAMQMYTDSLRLNSEMFTGETALGGAAYDRLTFANKEKPGEDADELGMSRFPEPRMKPVFKEVYKDIEEPAPVPAPKPVAPEPVKPKAIPVYTTKNGVRSLTGYNIDGKFVDKLPAKAKGGWLDTYEEGGPVFGEQETVNFNDFVIDIDDKDVKKFYSSPGSTQGKYSKIHADSGKACLAGALNCNQDLAQKLDAKPIRTLMLGLPDIKDTEYKKESKEWWEGPEDFRPNESYDTWEIGDALVNEGLATEYYSSTPKADGPKVPKDLDYKNIPIGSLILQGNAKGTYTKESEGDLPRHTATVVGYDPDGIPLVYDYGELKRVTNTKHPINRVIVPKGYENYTYDKMQGASKKRIKDLGYENYQAPEREYRREDVKIAYDVLDKESTTIGSKYKINSDLMEKLKDRIIGIGQKESKLGASIDLNIMDNMFFNDLVKPTYKKLANELSSESEGYPDWKIEMMAAKELGIYDSSNPKFKKKYSEYRSKYPLAEKDYRVDSSRGPYQIKDIPDFAREKYGINEKKLSGPYTNDDQELQNGALTSLILLSENFNKYKNKYKDMKLSDDEILDIATIAYNNSGKANSEDFVKFYIKNKKMSDGYLIDVKNLTDVMLNKKDRKNPKPVLTGMFKMGGNVPSSSKNTYNNWLDKL